MATSKIGMYQILGLKKKKNDVGIEIEVEYTKQHNDFPVEHWLVKNDNSLRYNGYEYVTNGPIAIEDSSKMIKNITNYINSHSDVIHNSPRTSVHVHSNILNHTFKQTMNQVAISWLLENVMIKFCNAKQREGNLFCLRVKDAENIIRMVQTILDGYIEPRGQTNLRSMKNANIRYASTNIRAVSEFGSIEYRGMCGGKYDYTTLNKWVNLIYAINQHAMKFSSPEEIMDTYYRVSIDEFLTMILGDAKEVIYQSSMDYGSLIKEQEGIVMPFAYRYDWDSLEQKVINFHLNKKDDKENKILPGFVGIVADKIYED